MSTYGYLAHHGIKGQKWGVRRYQNPDGTLTPAGRERYYKDRIKELKNEYNSKTPKEKRSESGLNRYIQDNYGENYKEDKKISEKRSQRRVRTGAAIGLGAAAAITAAVVGADALGTMSLIQAGNRNMNNDFTDRVNNILNDKSTMDKLEADTKAYRILYGNEKDKQKIINESLYVTDNQGDRELYKNILGNMQGGPSIKKEITYKLKNDVYSAQGKVLFDFALEAVGSDKSLDDLDMNKIKDYEKRVNSSGIFGMYKQKVPEGYDDYKKARDAIFNLPRKNSSGKLTDSDSIRLRDKLIEEGYGAVKDYTDAGILGKTPRVLLNAENDLEINKIKEVNMIDEVLAKLKLGALRFGT